MMRYDMKIGFCQKCGRAVKVFPDTGDIKQADWDRKATQNCGCMQISVHGRRKTVQGFKQLDLRDLGI